MDSDTQKMYELKSQIIQAVAHPIRLAIIEFLVDSEQCVCDIVDHVGAQRSNVSRHLSLMLKAGILTSRKEGLKVIYTLRTPCIVKFLGCVEDVLKQRMQSDMQILCKLN